MVIKVLFPALPYSNGNLHLGHFMSTFLVPSVIYELELILKRYFPILISGGDNYGTKNYFQITDKDRIRQIKKISFEHCQLLSELGVFFNFWGNTSTNYHHRFVDNFFRRVPSIKRRTYTSFCVYCDVFLGESYYDVNKIPPLTTCKFCKNPKGTIWKPTEDYFFVDIPSFVLPTVISKVPIINKIINEEPIFKNELEQITWNLNFGVNFPEEPALVIAVWWEAICNWISSFNALYSPLVGELSKYVKYEIFCGSDILWQLTHKLKIIFGYSGIPIENILVNPRFMVASSNLEKLSKTNKNYTGLREYLCKYGSDFLRFFGIYNDPEKKNFLLDQDTIELNYNSVYLRQLILPLETYKKRFYEVEANKSTCTVNISIEQEIFTLLSSYEFKKGLKLIIFSIKELSRYLLRELLTPQEYNTISVRMGLLLIFLKPICPSYCTEVLGWYKHSIDISKLFK